MARPSDWLISRHNPPRAKCVRDDVVWLVGVVSLSVLAQRVCVQMNADGDGLRRRLGLL